MFYVYDLDGTILDGDKLLPLAEKMRSRYYKGDFTIICTAQVLTPADYQFLDDNKIWSDGIISRPEGVEDSEADLKEFALDEFFEGMGYTGLDDVRVVMYENNLDVIERLRSRGVLCSVEGIKYGK